MAEAHRGRTNADWFARAQRVIPGGVDSPVRSFASVGGTPYTVVSGQGPYVVDAEGTRYIDLVQSYGAVLLGHAHPVVTAAIGAAAAAGTTFGAPTPGEVLLAEAICDRVPGCEQVRLVSSGTEAAMSAVRLARGATGRDRVVKFDGCYHGHSDGLLAGGGSGVATLGPARVGRGAGRCGGRHRGGALQRGARARRHGGLRHRRAGGGQHEPGAAGRPASWPVCARPATRPAPCSIFDEVITGFRLGPGGATAWSGVTPDLWCFGKVIGGGLPVGAFGGRARAMADAGPGRPGVPGRHALGEPAGHGGRPGRARRRSGRPTTPSSGAGSAASPTELESAIAPGGLAVAAPPWDPWSGSSRPGRTGPVVADRLRAAQALAGNGVYPRLLPRHAAPGGGAGPGSLRGAVPRAGPRRDGAGPGGRGGGGGRSGGQSGGLSQSNTWSRSASGNETHPAVGCPRRSGGNARGLTNAQLLPKTCRKISA